REVKKPVNHKGHEGRTKSKGSKTHSRGRLSTPPDPKSGLAGAPAVPHEPLRKGHRQECLCHTIAGFTRALSTSGTAKQDCRFAASGDAGTSPAPLQTPPAPGRCATGPSRARSRFCRRLRGCSRGTSRGPERRARGGEECHPG